MATAFSGVSLVHSGNEAQANRILEHIEDGLNFTLGRGLTAEFEGIKDRFEWRFEGDRLHVAFVINGSIDIPRHIEGAFDSLYDLIRNQANLIRYHLRLGDTLRPVEPGTDGDYEDLEIEPTGLEPVDEGQSAPHVMIVTADVFRPNCASS
jgi:hypothetical protein